MTSEFLQFGCWQSRVNRSTHHSLNSAPPLFDEMQLVENSSNYSIPKLRNTTSNIFDRQSEWKQSRVVHFDQIIENGDSDTRAELSLISMYDRIDDGVSNGYGRYAPAVLAPHRADHSLSLQMFLNEQYCFFGCLR